MDKQRTLRLKTPIILLSIISLLFTILSCISYFVYYDWENINGNDFYELTVVFPDIFDIIYILLIIAPCVLLVIYLLEFYNEFKATVLVPIIFGLIAIMHIYCNIESFIYGDAAPLMYLIPDILAIVTFSLATISALKGFPKKVFLIIAIVTGLFVEVMSTINLFENIGWYLEDGLYLYLFSWGMEILGAISLYVALLLFGFAVSTEKEKNAEKMGPEQALKLLKDKFELGVITEEEYQAQRNEIISKL